MNKLNSTVVDALAEAVGVHTLLDALLSKMDNETALHIVQAIMAENGLDGLEEQAS